MVYLIRRMKLGKTSCKGIVANSQTGIQAFRNDAKLPNAELVFRWGCTSDVPCENVVNSAKAIHVVTNKSGFRFMLQKENLCPETWFETEQVKYPAVVRPSYHAQGRKLYVVNNLQELQGAIRQCGGGWYASKLIDKIAEYRVFVVSGRAVWVAKKTPANPEAVAWNVAQGGKFENVRWDEWPLKAVKNSIAAFKLSGLDFGGVDIMVDEAGNTYVLEINAAPSQTSNYRQACTAKAFDWIVKNGKKDIPLVEARGGYKKFIHPAISGEAMV